MESAVKQLLIGLVTLDIVDTDSLVQAWKSLEVVPRSSIGAEYFNYFGNNHKISFEIGGMPHDLCRSSTRDDQDGDNVPCSVQSTFPILFVVQNVEA